MKLDVHTFDGPAGDHLQMFGWASLQTVKRYAVVADSALDDIASSIV